MSTTATPPPWETPPEHLFADLLSIAAAACRAPCTGLYATGTGRLSLLGEDPGFWRRESELGRLCRETAESRGPVVLTPPRRADGRGVRSFAGVPVRSDGRSVWALFVADTGYREFGADDVKMLSTVARQVEGQFESLRSAHAAETLNWVASVAHRASDLRMALRACLTAVCEHDGWPIGHVCVPAGSGEDTLVPTDLWHCRDESRFEALREAVERTRRASGPGTARDAEASSGVRHGVRLAEEPTATPVALEDPRLSRFALPVRAGGELVAVVEFFDTEQRLPSPHLRDVARDLGRELGVAAARIRDREDLERGRAELRDTVHQLRQIIATADDAFIAIDEEGLITEWNAAAEAMFGWTREEVLGSSLADTVVPERHRDAHRAGLARLKATGEGVILGTRVELAALRRDGREFPIELVVWEPLPSGPYRFNAFVRDISERRRVDAALREAYLREQEVADELRRIDQAKTEFIATVSHELRTPLTSIAGYLELLTDGVAGPLSEDQLELTAIVQRNTRRLLVLIEDILTVGKIDSGHFEPKLSEVDLSALVATAVQRVAPKAERLEITVTAAAEPVVVLADVVQLERAIRNILDNAVKFTPGEGGAVEVTVGRDDGGASLVVRDNGIGIPEDAIPKLFTRFYRSPLSVEREIQGSGLGLSIVKHVVERHGGRVEVESEVGKGTSVTVTLPVPEG